MNRQELLQNAKPILFNTAMVKAILNGKKSCTRRVIKYSNNINPSATLDDFAKTANDWECVKGCCQYQVGDILWVRETWCDISGEGYPYWYKADFPLHWDADEVEIGIPVDLVADDYKWCPSIHMPKTAARIFLKVTAVKVERLHQARYFEFIAEGIPYNQYEKIVVQNFANLWDSTIKKQDIDRYGWKANPWGWVSYPEWVETREDLSLCVIESGCILGYDKGRIEDEPTEKELQDFEDWSNRK